MKKQCLGITAKNGSTPAAQLSDCLSTLNNIVKASGNNKKNILKQNIFLKASDNRDYHKQKEELTSILNNFYSPSLPPTSFIGQPPENKKFVSTEILLLSPESKHTNIEHKKIEKLPYTVVDYPDYKEVHGAGLTAGKDITSTAGKSKKTFELLSRILKKESLSFSDIVHQWNYIEDITGYTTSKKSRMQNYQLFNDIRTLYYSSVDFPNGYPAATGIGTNTGGIVIDFTAASPSKSTRILPISNPRQVDAHKYSQKVLIGKGFEDVKKKGSPKFERAKVLTTQDSGQVYISGTAAILGQKTETGKNAREQTQVTLENISRLISADNLKAHGIDINTESKPSYIRVYVKNEADIRDVKETCQAYLGEIPSLYLVSDICRKDLLVEIEGVLYFTVSHSHSRRGAPFF